jgi:hypothetical protein
VGSHDRVGVGIKFNDSDVVGNSSSAMSSTLTLGCNARNSDILRSVSTAFEAVGTLKPASTAYLGTGINVTIDGRVGNVINTVDLYRSKRGGRDNFD